MVSTPQHLVEFCTHERRPGTTVCLHCRHAARVAARKRLKRVMFRGAAVALVFATFVAAGILSATAIRGNGRRAAEHAAQSEARLAASSAWPRSLSDPTGRGSERAIQQGESLETQPAPLVPVVPVGETPLPDGLTARRADSTVTLSFDTPLSRTRIPERFEQFVRATLPIIYGPSVNSVLAKLPQGEIARQGNLLSQLPSRGVLIPIGTAWAIRLFPETRLGRDGPLVIRYRVSVVSKGQ